MSLEYHRESFSPSFHFFFEWFNQEFPTVSMGFWCLKEKKRGCWYRKIDKKNKQLIAITKFVLNLVLDILPLTWSSPSTRLAGLQIRPCFSTLTTIIAISDSSGEEISISTPLPRVKATLQNRRTQLWRQDCNAVLQWKKKKGKKLIWKGFCLTTSCLHKWHWSINGLFKQNNREYNFSIISRGLWGRHNFSF